MSDLKTNNSTDEEKIKYQAELFSNRLSKQYKSLKKWARKERIMCYRLYDKDIQAIQFISEENAQISANNADFMQSISLRQYLLIALYERPYEKAESEEEIWLNAMADAAAKTLNGPRTNIILKTRKKLRGTKDGREEQYEKIETERHITGKVMEQGQLFNINLTDYLDTGLFFDHRPLRAIVRNSCSGKHVLNLFCYTGSFSVYAAEGKAKTIESVDMSNTYLEWAKQNLKLNGYENPVKYTFTRADVIGFLNQKNAEVSNLKNIKENLLPPNRWDLIILDPPTFSNSKRTERSLDINKDWNELVAKCIKLLTPGGILYFSTNSKRLKFDSLLIDSDGIDFSTEDITSSTIPTDYRNAKIHRCWKITRAR